MGRRKNQPCNCGAKLFNAGATEQGFRIACSKCKKRWTADAPIPPRPRAITRESHGPCGCNPPLPRVTPWTHGRFHLRCRLCKRSWIADKAPEHNPPARAWNRRTEPVAREVLTPEPEPLPDPVPTPPPIARPFSADKPYDDRLITGVDLAAGTPLGIELEGDDYLRYCEICKAPRENVVITYSPKEAAR